MKRILQYIFLFVLMCFTAKSFAQNTNTTAPKTRQDSVIQLYGVVMSADSLRALPGASIIVAGKNRGTLSNEHGVFSIVVLKGDEIVFSFVGFKEKTIKIPTDLKEDEYSLIQLLINDTAYLPATIIRPRPSRAQFERDFVNTEIPADELEIARRNAEEAKSRILISSLPSDGCEAVNQQLRQNANKYYYAGQTPPIQLLNPAAWADFIKAWKRGDFKKKKS